MSEVYGENIKIINLRRKEWEFSGNQFVKKEKPAKPEVLSEEESAEECEESESNQSDPDLKDQLVFISSDDLATHSIIWVKQLHKFGCSVECFVSLANHLLTIAQMCGKCF